jgi:hypothetical protein
MVQRQPEIEMRYRSLLQKAVRRGHSDLVLTTSALLESLSARERKWYRTRTAIIAFEECWPLGSELIFNRKFYSKVAALIKVTQSRKCREAAGLGYLTNAYCEGDAKVLNGASDDKHIKILANAVKRPDDFWQWIETHEKSEKQAAITENAVRFKHEGSSRDKAVIQAAAYLAVTKTLPPHIKQPPPEEAFPYWIVFDKHTPEGKLVLRDIARDLHIPAPQLEWSFFYFEGAQTNGEIPSKWWDRICRHHFDKVKLPIEEAHLLWEPAKPQIIEALADYGRDLHKELYRWKLSNIEQIEALKRQVELFIEHFEEVHRDQMNLFAKDQLDNS